jgi:predicted alpha/beta hydrolase
VDRRLNVHRAVQPGPGTYEGGSSIGPQVSSAKQSNAAFGFGSGTRQSRAKGKRRRLCVRLFVCSFVRLFVCSFVCSMNESGLC